MFSKLFILFLSPWFHRINLQYRLYPRWTLSRDRRIPCKTDRDCPFPAACCNDPFFPTEYCCLGWNYRKMEYAYARQIIQS